MASCIYPRSTAFRKHYWQYEFLLFDRDGITDETMYIVPDLDADEGYIVEVELATPTVEKHRLTIRHYKTFRSAEKCLLKFFEERKEEIRLASLDGITGMLSIRETGL